MSGGILRLTSLLLISGGRLADDCIIACLFALAWIVVDCGRANAAYFGAVAVVGTSVCLCCCAANIG